MRTYARGLAISLAVSAGVAGILHNEVAEVISPAPQQEAVVRVQHVSAPYGGCDEAWQAPNSAGARWCRARTFRHFTRWQRVSRELADALAESGAPRATTRKWERCVVRYGKTTTVVCPDGYVTRS